MKEVIEIIIIQDKDLNIGMDAKEITFVMSKERFNEYKIDNSQILSIDQIIKVKEKIDFSGVLQINGKEGDLLIKIPTIDEVRKCTYKEILLVPEYIKKLQKPFFVWGFLEHKNELIMLITFSEFIKGVKYGKN